MDFGAITGLLSDFDPAALLPELDTFLGKLELAMRLCILAGPLLLLALGLWYRYAPPKQANYKIGFLTPWGMGSEKAWRYTQRLTGICFTVLGGALSLVMLIISFFLQADKALDMVNTALTCMLWQLGLVLVCWIGIQVMVALKFDWKGNVRQKK